MTKTPSYRQHVSGQARVTINGRDYYLGLFGSKASKTAYDRIIAEWLSSGRSPRFGLDGDDLTIVELVLSYAKFAKAYYGSHKGSDFHKIMDALKPLRELYDDLSVSDFGPQQFKAVRERMIDRNWARKLINQRMRRLVRMFKWAAADGMIPPSTYDVLRLIDPLKKGRTRAKESEPVKPVDLGIVKQTCVHLTPILRDMIELQLLTCCRPGEVCRITPSMIDQSGEAWEIRLDKHKTAWRGKTRVLYLGLKGQAIVAKYLDRDPQACIFQPCESEIQRREIKSRTRKTSAKHGNRAGYSDRTREGRESLRAAGDRYTTESYGKAITYGCKKAFPVPEGANDAEAAAWRKQWYWSPNQLRHTRGTELRKKHGIEVTSVIMGHSDIVVTQVYAEQDREKAIQIQLAEG